MVVGGSMFASVAFTHLSYVLFGENGYAGNMASAVLIPLVIADHDHFKRVNNRHTR